MTAVVFDRWWSLDAVKDIDDAEDDDDEAEDEWL